MPVSISLGKQNSLKSIIIISLVLILFGVLLITFNATSLNKSRNWVETTAQITEIRTISSGSSTTHEVKVKYTFNDVKYENMILDYYDSSMQPQQIIPIKVNPSNPTQFMYANMSTFTGLFIGGGCMIGVGVLIPTVSIYLRVKKKKKANSALVEEKTSDENIEEVTPAKKEQTFLKHKDE